MIPLNGRIAIVDDQMDQAMPLIRIFSKNNIPYTYYPGNDLEFLPEEPENDIRLMFLDLNLLDGRDYQPRDIVSTLFSVITKLISPNNYPYVIILWSRQENEYKEMLEKIFHEELRDRAPIVILNWIKSNFFHIGEEEEVHREEEYKIIIKLKEVLSSLPSYSHLIQWENCVHNSANTTLQEIFKDFYSHDNWQDNANCILDMFAHSYLEKHYNDSTSSNKAKASLKFLTEVFFDSVETFISNSDFSNAIELVHNVPDEQKMIITSQINESLLLSKLYESAQQPGCIISVPIKENEKFYHELFNDCFSKNNLDNKEAKRIKEEAYKTMIPCDVVVTPACDYAQNKIKYDRIIRGVMIDAEHDKIINQRSEAIFVSPIFNYESRQRRIVLDFRYFKTIRLANYNIKPLFRLRHSILSEIQSKLSRHINRQGIMNL